MKSIAIAALMAVSASAFAYTVDYGPASTAKAVTVCEKDGLNCSVRNYRFTAPRVTTQCWSNGKGENLTCAKIKYSSNVGTLKFSSKKEADEFYRKMERGNH